MRRICVFNGDMSRGGGTERMTQILANGLAKFPEYKVIVISLSGKDTRPFYPLNDNVDLFYLNISGNFCIFKVIYRMYSLLRQLSIDIVINVDVVLGIYTFPLKILGKKVKIVSWEMFSVCNDLGISWIRQIRQLALWLSDYYVCLTENDCKELKRMYSVKIPLICIYNPYIGYRSAYNDLSSKNIITVGNFYKTKGFDLAVLVAEKLFIKHPDWKWYFYGDGIELSNIIRMVKDRNLENNIIFGGRISGKDIICKYEQASIYVMTSRSEGFGLVLLEAMAKRLPVIAFDVPFGPREIIKDKINGELIPAFDINIMSDSLDRLISNKELRKSYSNHSQDDMNRFSLDKFIERWKSIL